MTSMAAVGFSICHRTGINSAPSLLFLRHSRFQNFIPMLCSVVNKIKTPYTQIDSCYACP